MLVALKGGEAMSRSMALRIKVEFVETEAEPSSDRCPQEEADGEFSLVLPEAEND